MLAGCVSAGETLDAPLLLLTAQHTQAGELARRVQRVRGDSLSAAGVHHLRGRSLLVLADCYSEQVWDAHPRARRFFAKHRGFGVAHSRAQLADFRLLFLRAALGASERACELAPSSLECACLLACVLWALCATQEDGRWAARLLEAAERGLMTSCGGEERAAEVQALYGAHAHAAASVGGRRALLEGLRVQERQKQADARLQELLSTWARTFATASVEHALEQLEPWTPWSSPWKGLELLSELS